MGSHWFSHQGRDRYEHACERCGGPVYDVRQRWCEPCRVSGGPANRDHWVESLDLDAPIDEPPLDYPFGLDDLPTLPNLPTLRSLAGQAALLRQALEASRSLADRQREAVAARVCGDVPVGFSHDPRCILCCKIMTEYLPDAHKVTPTIPDFLCPRHSTDWRDYDPETGAYRDHNGPAGQEAAS